MGVFWIAVDTEGFGADFGADRALGHDLGQSNVRICPHLSLAEMAYLIEMWLDH